MKATVFNIKSHTRNIMNPVRRVFLITEHGMDDDDECTPERQLSVAFNMPLEAQVDFNINFEDCDIGEFSCGEWLKIGTMATIELTELTAGDNNTAAGFARIVHGGWITTGDEVSFDRTLLRDFAVVDVGVESDALPWKRRLHEEMRAKIIEAGYSFAGIELVKPEAADVKRAIYNWAARGTELLIIIGLDSYPDIIALENATGNDAYKLNKEKRTVIVAVNRGEEFVLLVEILAAVERYQK